LLEALRAVLPDQGVRIVAGLPYGVVSGDVTHLVLHHVQRFLGDFILSNANANRGLAGVEAGFAQIDSAGVVSTKLAPRNRKVGGELAAKTIEVDLEV
jgi:hypothetical protein